MLKLIYRVLTASLAAFVAYSGYCVYSHAKQTDLNKKCSYETFQSQLIDILHREASKSKNYVHLCELNTAFARRDYFIQKVKAANTFIELGDVDGGVKELIEALAVCSKPAALLEYMSLVLPIPVYKQLSEKLWSLA